MRVLWYNKLKDAVITVSSESTHMNANFPKENLLINSLSIPFRSIQPSVYLTVVFDETVPMNAIALAGHNLSTLRYRIFDDTDTVVEDNLIVDIEDTEMLYTTVQEAKKLIFTLNASSYVEIGYLSVGEHYQMPNPVAYYDEDYEITNERIENAFGNVHGANGVMLRTYAPTFINVSDTAFKEILQIINAVRNYETFFVDMTEENHNYKAPLYGTMNLTDFTNARYSKGILRKNFDLLIKEAK